TDASWPARRPRQAGAQGTSTRPRTARQESLPSSSGAARTPPCRRPASGSFAAMIDRYSTPEMKALWSEAERYRVWLEVELAATAAFEELGEVPAGTAEAIRGALADRPLDEAFAARVADPEAVPRPDLAAFTRRLPG